MSVTQAIEYKPNFTRHAQKRLTARGIKGNVVELITIYGDREARVGERLIALSLSANKIRELIAENIVKPQQVSSLSKTVVLLNEDRFQVVSAFARYGKKGRRYDHGIKYSDSRSRGFIEL